MSTIKKHDLDLKHAIFQHDNSWIHTFHLATKWLEDRKIKVLSWPAHSPDLNPIENVWSMVKTKLYDRDTEFQGVNELWDRALEIWKNEIPVDHIKNVIESMCWELT